MESVLQEFLGASVFAFILTFTRVGTAVMIMPGIGDSFVSNRIRLNFAVGLTFVLFPMIMPFIPSPLPAGFGLLVMIVMEIIIGLFFGTIARIFMTALDTTGMIISISSGLGNAQLFNPSLAAQGSLIGAFMSVTGVALMFSLNLHHLLFMGIFESYSFFPVGAVPDSGSMADLVARAVTHSFAIGVMIGAPFMVLSLMVYTGMGVLARLMPQIQVFILALPIQILLAITLLMIIFSSAVLFWAKEFESAMVFFLRASGA
jgi:flagellar biosynthetic protein FliR